MTAPGWYPDPNNPRNQIYWDGSQWTGHHAPSVGTNSQTTRTDDESDTGPITSQNQNVNILAIMIGVGVAGIILLALAALVIMVIIDKPWKSDDWKRCVAEGPMIAGQSESELESACDRAVEFAHTGQYPAQ